MPRYGSSRISINHQEGRCWLPAPSCSPSSALPRLIHTRVTERKKHRAAKPVTAVSKNRRGKQRSWVLFNRPLMLQRHEIGTWVCNFNHIFKKEEGQNKMQGQEYSAG